MGLFGFVKKIFGGGGGGSSGYNSQNVQNYEDQTAGGLSNMLGGVSQTKDKNGHMQYNFGEGFKDFSGPEGVSKASSGYDFSPTDQAMQGFRTPKLFSPKKFTFGDNDLIDQESALQYGMGAGDVNRQGQGSLTKLRETIGTRRPGLLLQAGAQNQRDTGENLAKLKSGLSSQAMASKLQLGKEQQTQQADEDYRGFGANADESFRNNQALAEAGNQKIGVQSGLVQNERENQDKIMDYLKELFYNTSRLNSANSQASNAAGASKSSGALGTIASMASKFI